MIRQITSYTYNITSGDTTNDVGLVKVYEYSAGSWNQLGATIEGQAANEYFGGSLSLSDDGKILAVGAAGGNGTTRIYEYSEGSWNQVGSDIATDSTTSGGKGTCCATYVVDLTGDASVLAIGAGNSGEPLGRRFIR